MSSMIDISGTALWYVVVVVVVCVCTHAIIPARSLTVGGLYIHVPFTIGLAI